MKKIQMKKTRLRIIFGVTISVLLLAFMGCDFRDTGTVNLSITDSPIDAENVESVIISITKIEYHTADPDEWVEVPGFGEPKEFDLLSLTEGNFESLGEFYMPAGIITQIRFYLDAVEQGQSSSNPGCYIKLADDETEHPLFVPSGSESGFKATGAFEVPVNSTVSITADFDVRKSVTVTANKYILKPTIRLVINDVTGKISGTVTGIPGGSDIIIYAYENGSYNINDEAADPEVGKVRFPNAVTSAKVKLPEGETDYCYTLAFLSVDYSYDLIAAEYNGDTYIGIAAGPIEDIPVEAKGTTKVDIVIP